MASDLSGDSTNDLSGDSTNDLSEVRDVLPEDLDRGFVGPYRFPSNARRRITGTLYVLAGVAMLVGRQLAGADAVLANAGITVCAVLLILLGLYHWLAGRRFGVDENKALTLAGAEVGFPVGHASIQLGWRGLLSRPTWRTLVFSAEEPPLQRALVLVDAVNGHIIDSYVEDVPEPERQAWPNDVASDVASEVSSEVASDV